MKYHCEVKRSDGWAPYRDDQKFNSPDAARRLFIRLCDRYGDDNVRVTEVGPERLNNEGDPLIYGAREVIMIDEVAGQS